MNRSLRIQIPLFILIRTLLNTTVRMVYPFLPVFGRGLGVDLGSLSLALSLRSAAGLFGPFLASAVDNRDRKTGMLLGLSLGRTLYLHLVRPGHPLAMTQLLGLAAVALGVELARKAGRRP